MTFICAFCWEYLDPDDFGDIIIHNDGDSCRNCEQVYTYLWDCIIWEEELDREEADSEE